jgi:uncharacterized protein (TIGR03435 family)
VTPSSPEKPPGCGNQATRTSFTGKGIPLDRVIRLIIAPRIGRLVVDRTGLTGTFDLDLRIRGPTLDSDLPSIETAIQEQLGLKLQAIREAADILVIDRIERPTAN